MKEFVFIFILLPITYSVKHTLAYFLTTSPGQKTIPEFVAVSMLDGVYVGYCDSNISRAEYRLDWMKKVEEDHPEYKTWHVQTCIDANHFSTGQIKGIQQFFNQTQGFHILQELGGCEFDDETDLYTGFDIYGYDGADFLSFEPKSRTWRYTERAKPYKHDWDSNKALLSFVTDFIETICPKWLKLYLLYGKTSLQRKVPPSVSLLQKSPSSPVSCFATGFYPNRADMFWRKDGDQTHEDVDHGEILPNPDGTFQMRVDLDLSSVRTDDWSRFDCVFRGSGAESDIVTRLDRAVIRTNWGPSSELPVAAVVMAAVALVLLLLAGVTGVFISRRLASHLRRRETLYHHQTKMDDHS